MKYAYISLDKPIYCDRIQSYWLMFAGKGKVRKAVSAEEVKLSGIGQAENTADRKGL